ncbi:MAG: hypothetical protein ACRDYV_20660, partial [Acidimicrobiia bacterium]
MTAIIAGVRRHRLPDRQSRAGGGVEPFFLIAAGLVVQAATRAGTVAPDRTSLSWVAVLALLSYPLLAAGLLRLLDTRLPDRRADVLVQAGLAATLFGLLL